MRKVQYTPLKEISVKITKGTTPTTLGFNFTDTGINFVKAESILRDGVIDANTFAHIDDRTNLALKRSIIEADDILLTIAGIYLGKVGLIKKEHLPANTNQAVAIIRPREKYLDSRYLKYFFLSESTNKCINSLCPQTAQPNLNLTQLGNLKIPLPALFIQKKISAALSAYDDLIENNNRRIAILEKMAEELYREWFVRLRFPGHERVRIIKGVPEGWEVRRLYNLGKVVTGKTPPTSNQSYFNGSYPFIKTPDMHDNLFVIDTEETLTEDGIQYQKTQILPPNSICVSCIGTGGVVAITSVISQTNQQINSIILNQEHYREWAFFTLRSMKEVIQLFGYTGSTMTNLSKGKFENLKCLMPSEAILIEFHNKTEGLLDFIHNLQKQILRLVHSRNNLLSRLISGKIDIENMDIQFPASMRCAEPAEAQKEAVHA